MNFSAFLGILISIGVLVGTIFLSTDKSKMFLDIHAFLIVVGGTLGASLLSFSAKKLWLLLKVFFRRVLGKNEEIFIAMKEIIDLAKGYRENDSYLKTRVGSLKTAFLKEGVELLLDGSIDPDDFDKIMSKRAVILHQRHEEDSEMFKSLSKFPPAFGLLGAVIGMISLMSNLGGADAFQKVGPSMAVALVATMYGIAVANFVFLPISENLARINRMDLINRSMILEGIKLLRAKKHPLVVEESLKSFLLPSERPKNRMAS